MKIFNIGVLEIAFILLLGLIVLGPKKAVEMAGDVGRWINKLVRSKFWKDLLITSREIQDLPKKIMNEAEIQRTIEELDRASVEIKEVLDEGAPESLISENRNPEESRVDPPNYS